MLDRTSSGKSGSAGFALLVVLAFLLIVSAIITPFAITARTRLMIARNETEHQRLSLLADGLSNVLAAELTGEKPPPALKINSEPAQCRIGPFNFEIVVQDHAGLIDLNAADDETLSLGFRSLGFDEAKAKLLATSVASYRGASTSVFSEEAIAGVGPATSKHAAFESVSELQDFRALARLDLRDLLSVFTIKSFRGIPAPERAPVRLRAAFGGRSLVDTAVYEGARISVYTIEVTVGRDGSGTAGHAGYVVEATPSQPGGFRRLSQVLQRQSGIIPPRQPIAQDCDMFFGTPVSNMIRKWGDE
ncbi:hypothetical protein [Mesorhizobium sp. NPDC059025]|uniref:hypothetical protein n=1 Tax=unclassified Mesorhizobium TaxID=325217 RepID=UPI0036B25ECC